MTKSDYVELVNTEEAARILGISSSKLAKSRVTGMPGIPFVKLGSAVRYRRSDLEDFVTKNLQTTTSETRE